MFCNYCGASNPDVAKFCRKCGKPIADAPRPSATGSQVPATAPHVDPPHVSAPVEKAIPAPVATPAPALSTGAEPRKIRSSSRTTVAVVAASLAVLLIVGAIFLHIRGEGPRMLKGHSGFISSVAFSPDSQMLASGSSDGSVKLWDTARGQWLRNLSSYANTDWVSFSPDGRTLASSGSSGHELVFWDAASGNQTRSLGEDEDAEFFGQTAFSPDGHLLVANTGQRGSNDGGLQLWDAASGNELRRFPGYAMPVFTPDGKFLAAENKSHSINFLDVESGNEVRTVGGNFAMLQAAIFSPDGRLLATLEYGKAMVTLWDAASGQAIRNINDSAAVRGIAFSSDNRLLATGSEDHTIKLWDVASGNKVRTLSGHSDSVNCVAFSPDGRWLASGGADGNVILWPLPQSR